MSELKYKIGLFKKKDRVGITCFFCKINKKTIGYINETSGEKLHYFFCKECLSEILQNVIKELKKSE